tara:strand:- start:50 stop:676 length:627 start_codon:yes stop_codon:yes gene_type:complete
MKVIFKKEWEKFYSDGKIPWNVPCAQEELIDILNMYRINSGTVLDIGCGTGSLCIELSKHKFKVTGVDISSTAIQLAKNKSDSQKVNFKVGDIFKKPLNKKFDLVVDTGCFHHNFNIDFVDVVAQHLSSKGLWYSAIGSNEGRAPFDLSTIPQVPPAFSLQDITKTVIPYFDVILIRTFYGGSVGDVVLNNKEDGSHFPFWSCLCRKT